MSIPLNILQGIGYTKLVNTKVKDYFTKAFLNWQNKSGERKTLGEFAEYLGEKISTVSMWMSGDRSPDREKIEKIFELLGPEIYDALDLPRPDPRLLYIKKHWNETSEDSKKKIAEEVAKFTTEKAPNDD